MLQGSVTSCMILLWLCRRWHLESLLLSGSWLMILPLTECCILSNLTLYSTPPSAPTLLLLLTPYCFCTSTPQAQQPSHLIGVNCWGRERTETCWRPWLIPRFGQICICLKWDRPVHDSLHRALACFPSSPLALNRCLQILPLPYTSLFLTNKTLKSTTSSSYNHL